MARKQLTDLDLVKNSINNARIQNLASDPSSPVVGQFYFNTATNKIRSWSGTTWDEYGTGAGSGDVTGQSSSVDGEITLFNSTTGKSIKRATGTGYVKVSSGVYQTPSGSIPQADVTNLTTDLAAKAPTASPTFTGTVTVPTPSGATDAASKGYVDSAIDGRAWKQAVRAATTGNGTLTTAFANGQAIDGVTLGTGDRILIKNQSAGAENGIYVVAASGAPARATDADTAAELRQATVTVQEGTANADSTWTMTNDGTVTVGTTALVWVLQGTNSIPNATTSAAGKVQLATQAEAQAKTDTAKALTAASVADFARKYTGTIGNGSSTSLAVTHGLGSQWVTAQVFDASTNEQVECDVVLTSSTQTTFTFAVAPTTNQYRVVITG